MDTLGDSNDSSTAPANDALRALAPILESMREQTRRPDVSDGGYTYSWKPEHWADEIEAALSAGLPVDDDLTREECLQLIGGPSTLRELVAYVIEQTALAADRTLSAGERSSAPTVTPSAAIEQPYKGAHGLVRNFLSRLPFPDRLPAPTVQVEDGGDLGIDWDESRDATVSVSLRESGVVCWAALINGRSEHGVFELPSWSPAFNDAMTRLGEALGERSSARPREDRPRPECNHDFKDYVVCCKCGQTAAATGDCHHCDDPTSRCNGRCWWCLKPLASSDEGREALREKALCLGCYDQIDTGYCLSCAAGHGFTDYLRGVADAHGSASPGSPSSVEKTS